MGKLTSNKLCLIGAKTKCKATHFPCTGLPPSRNQYDSDTSMLPGHLHRQNYLDMDHFHTRLFLKQALNNINVRLTCIYHCQSSSPQSRIVITASRRHISREELFQETQSSTCIRYLNNCSAKEYCKVYNPRAWSPHYHNS